MSDLEEAIEEEVQLRERVMELLTRTGAKNLEALTEMTLDQATEDDFVRLLDDIMWFGYRVVPVTDD